MERRLPDLEILAVRPRVGFPSATHAAVLHNFYPTSPTHPSLVHGGPEVAVIHDSKRHPGQPPSSCSPRSIGSSEFLNPIAHEVVLRTKSLCELKITGFGASLPSAHGALAHDADSDGGIVSSFVGTLRPGTLGPGWSHGGGLQFSGSCRGGSMQCMPPRSPNPLLDRDGAPTGMPTIGQRASCEVNAVKSGGKGSAAGLSCHRRAVSSSTNGRPWRRTTYPNMQRDLDRV